MKCSESLPYSRTAELCLEFTVVLQARKKVTLVQYIRKGKSNPSKKTGGRKKVFLDPEVLPSMKISASI